MVMISLAKFLIFGSTLLQRSSHVIAMYLTALCTDSNLYFALSFERDAYSLKRAE